MEIIAHNENTKKAIQLGTVAVGKVVRLYTTTFEAAIADDSNESFFLVTDEVKEGSVTLVPLNGKTRLKRSKDFPVFPHDIVIQIKK